MSPNADNHNRLDAFTDELILQGYTYEYIVGMLGEIFMRVFKNPWIERVWT
nr:hypothetical protein [uncultured Desulfobacter sp.]